MNHPKASRLPAAGLLVPLVLMNVLLRNTTAKILDDFDQVSTSSDVTALRCHCQTPIHKTA